MSLKIKLPSEPEALGLINGHDVRGVDTQLTLLTPLAMLTCEFTFVFADIEANEDEDTYDVELDGDQDDPIQQATMHLEVRWQGAVVYTSVDTFLTDNSMYSDTAEHNAWTYYAEVLAHNQLKYVVKNISSIIHDALQRNISAAVLTFSRTVGKLIQLHQSVALAEERYAELVKQRPDPAVKPAAEINWGQLQAQLHEGAVNSAHHLLHLLSLPTSAYSGYKEESNEPESN